LEKRKPLTVRFSSPLVTPFLPFHRQATTGDVQAEGPAPMRSFSQAIRGSVPPLSPPTPSCSKDPAWPRAGQPLGLSLALALSPRRSNSIAPTYRPPPRPMPTTSISALPLPPDSAWSGQGLSPCPLVFPFSGSFFRDSPFPCKSRTSLGAQAPPAFFQGGGGDVSPLTPPPSRPAL